MLSPFFRPPISVRFAVPIYGFSLSVHLSARFFLFLGQPKRDFFSPSDEGSLVWSLFFQVMRAVTTGNFIFLSDEGSPARHLYFIAPAGIPSSFFLFHSAITVVLANTAPCLAFVRRFLGGILRQHIVPLCFFVFYFFCLLL